MAVANNIPVVMPDDPNTPEFTAQIAALKPDFLFSFYYRMMLKPALLATATRGAYNMHGSLLPKYRGRVPINWAIIKGETETGATLHEMVEKPDAGGIAAQQVVAILPDETASERVWDAGAVAESLRQFAKINKQQTGYVFVDRNRGLVENRSETQGILTGGEAHLVPGEKVTLFLLRTTPVGIARWVSAPRKQHPPTGQMM